MNYYLCRQPPETASGTVTFAMAEGWPVSMIVETTQEPVPCWMYELTDGTIYYLQKTSKWEYDLMVALDIPMLPPDIIFYYAEGWKEKDVIRRLKDKLNHPRASEVISKWRNGK